MNKIGLAGFGFIGSYLYKRLQENEQIAVEAVWEPVAEKTVGLDRKLICVDLEDLGSRSLDLIVEVAHPDVVNALWPRITSGAHLMMASMTGLADPELRSRMESEAEQQDQKIFIPHGAVLGLDGLRDGRSLLESVCIRTTKHPGSLGIPDSKFTKPTVVFEGSARDACRRFPRNVNVHAAIALAGIGFESTRSIVIADPDSNTMRHKISVRGHGLNWDLEIESFSAGEVTGSYTPESLFKSVVGVLLDDAGFRII